MIQFLSSYCLFVPLALTAALGLPANQDTSLADAISQNNLTLPSNSGRHCTSDADWYGPSSFAEDLDIDCAGTYDALYQDYQSHDLHAILEFLPFGAAQVRPELVAVRTPRRCQYFPIALIPSVATDLSEQLVLVKSVATLSARLEEPC